MSSWNMKVHVGFFVGTGAEQTVEIGWRPRVILLFPDTAKPFAAWTDTMPDDAMALSGAVDETTAGIVATNAGFTIGADGDINVAATKVRFVALG